ncbi:hypothetical protein BOW50_11390 [Solemya velum gill symbiont]|uniref:hypothetical protein n=1 Tax=Solemya velum gill symbiont TaxID=2340 RepID=UPI0009986BB4|nr:hypothetical protein [Solemya velum gill symbiont]OOZ75530.1 hypothetical protein BOW50_11390 [Solemya velum gill symbiont]
MNSEQLASTTGTIHTVQTLADSEPALNEGGIRWIIYQHRNQLLSTGAIFYSGKKLLIDRDLFIEYLKNGITE